MHLFFISVFSPEMGIQGCCLRKIEWGREREREGRGEGGRERRRSLRLLFCEDLPPITLLRYFFYFHFVYQLLS